MKKTSNTKSKSKSSITDRQSSPHHKRKSDGSASSPHMKKRSRSGSASDVRESTAHLGRSASARVVAQRRREARRGSTERLTSSLLKIWEKMRVTSTSSDEKLRLAKHAIRALNRDDDDDDHDEPKAKKKSSSSSSSSSSKMNEMKRASREDQWKKACGSHRASRVVQAIFKYGGSEERTEACVHVTKLAPGACFVTCPRQNKKKQMKRSQRERMRNRNTNRNRNGNRNRKSNRNRNRKRKREREKEKERGRSGFLTVQAHTRRVLCCVVLCCVDVLVQNSLLTATGTLSSSARWTT